MMYKIVSVGVLVALLATAAATCSILRLPRQVSYPQLEQQQPPLSGAQQFGQQLGSLFSAPQQQQAAGQPGNSLLGLIGELGPQVQKAQSSMRMLTSLFSSQPGQPAPQALPLQAGGPFDSTTNQAGQLIGQLGQLQQLFQPNPATKFLQDAQQQGQQTAAGAQQLGQQTASAAQQVGQSSVKAAQQAQGSITAALTEIGQGLQRLATNNPMLIPDVKNLYQSVSSKLTSASNSVGQTVGGQQASSSSIVPAKNSEQLADNLAKVLIPGLQTPSA